MSQGWMLQRQTEPHYQWSNVLEGIVSELKWASTLLVQCCVKTGSPKRLLGWHERSFFKIQWSRSFVTSFWCWGWMTTRTISKGQRQSQNTWLWALWRQRCQYHEASRWPRWPWWECIWCLHWSTSKLIPRQECQICNSERPQASHRWSIEGQGKPQSNTWHEVIYGQVSWWSQSQVQPMWLPRTCMHNVILMATNLCYSPRELLITRQMNTR